MSKNALFLGFLAGLAAPQAPAQDPEPRTLVVGTREVPPFAMKTDGSWNGLAIELWHAAEERLGVQSEFRAMSVEELLQGLESGTLDAAVAALTVTPERERIVDFSQPFFTAGLGIAVRADHRGGLQRFLDRFPFGAFLVSLIALMIVLLVVSLLVWSLERRRNREQFGKGLGGLGAAFWWSGVTMTTVGYGDKAPRTLGGRVIAFVWMFVSLFLLSTFTATIASYATAAQLEHDVESPADLARAHVGSVEGTTSGLYLDRSHIPFSRFPSAREALAALEAGELDAVVYDEPILRYWARRDHGGKLEVLSTRFEEQNYAIGLPTGSSIREAINQAILERMQADDWRSRKRHYGVLDEG